MSCASEVAVGCPAGHGPSLVGLAKRDLPTVGKRLVAAEEAWCRAGPESSTPPAPRTVSPVHLRRPPRMT